MVILSVEKSVQLVGAFKQVLARPEFQEGVERLSKSAGITYSLGLSQLTARASKAASIEAGCGEWQIAQVKEALTEHADNLDIRNACREIESILRLNEGAIFGMKKDADPVPPATIVSHEKASSAISPEPVEQVVEVDALKLLEALRNVCSAPQFQSDVIKLHNSGRLFFQIGLSKLMGQAAKTAGSALGLGDACDFGKIKELVKPFGRVKEICMKAAEVEALLLLENGTLFGMKVEAATETLTTTATTATTTKTTTATTTTTTSTTATTTTTTSTTAATTRPATPTATTTTTTATTTTTKATGPVQAPAAAPTPAAPAATAAATMVPAGAEVAVKLLDTLQQTCRKKQFQADVERLYKAGGVTFQLGLVRIMGSAAEETCKAMGLADDWDMDKIKEIVKPHGAVSIVRVKACEVEQLLRLDPGTLFGMTNEVAARNHASQTVLLNALLEICRASSFQNDLQALKQSGGTTFQIGFSHLMKRAAKLAAGEVGLGDDWDMSQLKEYVNESDKDESIGDLARAVEREVGLHAGAIFGMKRTSEESSPAQAPTAQTSEEQATLILDALQRVCTRPQFQTDLDVVGKTGGVTFQLGLAKLVHKAASMVAQELSLGDGYDLGKIKEVVKECRGVLAVRQQSRAVERLLHHEPGTIFGMPESEDATEGGTTPEVQERPALQVDEDGIPILSVEQALALQQDLMKHYSDEEFQKTLKELEDKHGRGTRAFDRERQKCIMRVQKNVLPNHGFEGAPAGIAKMVAALGKVSSDDRINNCHKINVELLRLETFGKALFGGADRAQLDERGVPVLDLEHALALQEDLIEHFAEAGFRKQLRDLENKYKKGTRAFDRERQKCIMMVQKMVLPKYGFEGTAKGVAQMVAAFETVPKDDQLTINGHIINIHLLGLAKYGQALMIPNLDESDQQDEQTEESERAIQETPEPGPNVGDIPSTSVEVTVKHAVNEGKEAKLVVMSTATIKEVKAALAEELGMPEIARRGNLVRLVGTSGFSTLRDSEVIGTYRVFQLIGTDYLQHQEPVLAMNISEPTQLEQKAPEAVVTEDNVPSPSQVNEGRKVVIKHATHGDQEVTLTVKSGALMKDVKIALAEELGRPEIAEKGQLVRRVGSTFSSFTDKEKVGARKCLLITGIDYLKQVGSKDGAHASLTLQTALSVLKDWADGFGGIEFQKQHEELTNKHGGKSEHTRMEIHKLALSVQTVVLPKYGYEGTENGVLQITHAMREFKDDPEYKRLDGLCLALLGLTGEK